MPNFAEPAERHYTPDTLGGLCETCGNPMPAALAGETTHPTCDPDFQRLDMALRRALALRKARRP